MYISAEAIYSLEDMIDMHVSVYCCVSTGTRYYYCLLYHLLYSLYQYVSQIFLYVNICIRLI